MLIHFKDDSSHYELIVGLTGSVMRVAVAGCDDVSEFNFVNGVWISADRCEGVSFEFPPGVAQQEAFNARVTEALAPVKSLPGYLGMNDWVPENVN
jgi:hypothetical protein